MTWLTRALRVVAGWIVRRKTVGAPAGTAAGRRATGVDVGLALLVVVSGCYPTIRFDVAGPAVSLATTVQACPSPQASPIPIAPSGVVRPQ